MKKNQILEIIESSAISIASSFPVLSSIATGWNEYKNHIQIENVNNILNEFYNKLKTLDEKLDKSYLDSNDLKSLIIKTCFYGKEEISEKKRKYLGLFLANSCTITLSKSIVKNSILETIIKLSEFDIYLINLISENTEKSQNSILSGGKKYNPAETPWTILKEKDIIEKLKEFPEKDILSSLDYICGIGVIENVLTRNINVNFDYEIESYHLKKQREELFQLELSFTQDKMKNKVKYSSIEDIKKESNENEEKLYLLEQRENENGRLQKYYGISALGLNILSFIKE